MARKDPQFNFRMPEELKSFLAFMAQKNRRSLNAELISRLTESIDDGDLYTYTNSIGLEGNESLAWMEQFVEMLGIDLNLERDIVDIVDIKASDLNLENREKVRAYVKDLWKLENFEKQIQD